MTEDMATIVKSSVKEALAEHHVCIFDAEERQLLKDFIGVGTMFKKAIMKSLVVGVIMVVLIGAASVYHFVWGK